MARKKRGRGGDRMYGRVGHWAFIVGILLAIIAGLVPSLQTTTITWILIVLGLIVGFLNITGRETTDFLVATIALLLVGGSSVIAGLGLLLAAILGNIVAFVAPAALLVALRAIYGLAAE